MLEHLALDNVGPAPAMALDFAQRMNLVTGDNGLGKSFLLDVAWWVLTRHWPREVNHRMTSGYPARPHDTEKNSTIRYRVHSSSRLADTEAVFLRSEQVWIWASGWLPIVEGLVVYAHADGSFSVWDSARNYWTRPGESELGKTRPPYVFTEAEVWGWGSGTPRTVARFPSATGCCTTGPSGFMLVMTTLRAWPQSCGRCPRIEIRLICSGQGRPCVCRLTIHATFRPSRRLMPAKFPSFMRRPVYDES